MKFKAIAAIILAMGASSAAHAGVLISDNFNLDTPGLNWAGDTSFISTSPAGNAPGAASVDLIGNGAYGSSFDFLPGNGYYVDLDGTTGYGNAPVAGQLTSKQSFGAGVYTLSFDLAGNQRVSTEQTTVVSLGGMTIFSITPTSYLQGFTHYTSTFTTTGGVLQFTEQGPSNQQGNLLDNVKLTSGVPEPATWAMLMVGFAGIGAMLRRQNRVALAA